MTNYELKFEEALQKHNKFLHKMAHKYAAASKMTHDDIYQQAALFLFEAVKTFDPTKGVQEHTHYYGQIQMRLLNYIRDKKEIVKTPRDVHDIYQSLRKRGLSELDLEEMIAAGVNEKDAQIAIKYRDHCSSHASIDQTSTRYNNNPRIASVEKHLGGSYMGFNDTIIAITKHITSPRQMKILKLVSEGYKLSEASEILGISKATAAREMREIRERLRPMEEQYM